MNLLLAAFLVASMSCPKPIIENKTDEWNRMDIHTVNINKDKFCSRKTKMSPCMIKLTKVRYNTYYIICGQKKSS